MSPQELVDEVIKAGGDVVLDRSGQAKIMGRLPGSLIDEIRASKPEFLEAWKDELASRFRRVPVSDLPLAKTPPKWSSDRYRRVESYIRRQGDACTTWVFHQGNRYVDAGMTVEVAARCALRDLLHWQMRRHVQPEEVVEGFELCTKGVKR